MPELKNPLKEIEKENAWYTDDQFANQLGSKSGRWVIENRWRIFGQAIDRWMSHRFNNEGKETFRILDAGCGDGINLKWFIDTNKKNSWGASIFSLDYNPLRAQRAINIPGHSGTINASLLNIPYRQGSFDLVFCNHVLEHIEEDEKALKELARVLKDGGLLILGVPNEGCMIAQLRNNWLQPSIKKATDHIQFYTAGTLSKKMIKSGFQILELMHESFFMPHSRLNALLAKLSGGRMLLDFLKGIFPSQAGGLIVIATKKASEDSN